MNSFEIVITACSNYKLGFMKAIPKTTMYCIRNVSFSAVQEP